ncbi:MAG: hypothetical protein AAGA85_09425 [Bacteroidota bacterium]
MKHHYLLTLLVPLLVISCNDEPQVAQLTFPVELQKNERYTYNTEIGGDEEGVSIVTQANHFEISEIIRDQSTGFVAVYEYQPAVDFVGSDWVELRLETGSDGMSIPVEATLVRINFNISE